MGGVNINRKFIYIFTFLIICLSVATVSYSKYIFLWNLDVASVNLDRTKPTIEVISVENSNTKNREYANSNDIITFMVEVKEKNINLSRIEKSDLEVYVGDVLVSPNIEIGNIEKKNNTFKCLIRVSKILENGILKISFKEGTIVDKYNWKSELYTYQTDITVDNINV